LGAKKYVSAEDQFGAAEVENTRRAHNNQIIIQDANYASYIAVDSQVVCCGKHVTPRSFCTCHTLPSVFRPGCNQKLIMKQGMS